MPLCYITKMLAFFNANTYSYLILYAILIIVLVFDEAILKCLPIKHMKNEAQIKQLLHEIGIIIGNNLSLIN